MNILLFYNYKNKCYNKQMKAIIWLTIILVLLHAYSCSKMQTKIDFSKVYKNDITILTRNPDKEFMGVGTLPRKSLHTLEFIAEDKVDLLSIRSCSREEILREPKSVFNKRKFLYNYRPNEIESSGVCPITIHALSKEGLFASGFLSVESEYTTLPAHLVCGGITEDANGVSVCQARINSIELIRFDEEVVTEPDVGCELESGNRGKQFEFKVKKGWCSYSFIQASPPYKLHLLDVLGYEEIRIGVD